MKPPAERIAELNIHLPPLPKSGGVYKPVVIAGGMAYVSGHVSRSADGQLITGRVGKDLTLEQGKDAARQVGLAILAALRVRDQTGAGQYVEPALMRTATNLLNYQVAGYALGGWGLNGTIRLNDGFPTNPTATVVRSAVTTQRFQEGSSLDLISGGNQNSTRAQNPDAYFDVNQYAYPRFNCANTTDVPGGPCVSTLPAGQFQGNIGRNTLMAPGNATVDISMKKEAKLSMLGEQGALTFRAEFFNILNRPNFGTPNLTIFGRTGRGTDMTRLAEASRIDKTRGSSRQIQLSLRVAF